MATPPPTETPQPSPEPADEDAPAEETDVSVDWRAFVPTDVADHLATMARAARNSGCGVPWQLLAAIARVESNFGRNMATSSAGAIGYGQFLPSSWTAFGSEGNAYDYRDALPAIALYLCHAGLERDPRVALFAYNHADWYVDLVLDLAVRYDRMAPGAPTPAVLGVGPAEQSATPIQYASGRDLRSQTRARSSPQSSWLGVPWHGRAPGQPIAADALETTALSMLRGAFGLQGDLAPAESASGSEDVAGFADRAWDAGLLARPSETGQWSPMEVRRYLERGEPVVVFVGNRRLPGHPRDELEGEQPLVIIGATQTGFIYSDPTFASSLGYGLEMQEADLLRYWDAAARPRQALALGLKPRISDAHIAQAQPPLPIARVLPTPTPTPTAVPPPTATPIPAPTLPAVTRPVALADRADTSVVVRPPTAEPAQGGREEAAVGAFGLLGIGALAGAAFAVRRWRLGRAAATPPRSGPQSR